jgi:MYXO-CTERM domain-containing protein
LRWTYAWEDANEDAWAEWLLDLEEAGEYRVEVFLVADFAKSKQARYALTHAGQTEELRLDMTSGAGWRELGTFNFAAGGEQSLAIFDNTGDPLADRVQIMADAVRLTPAGNTPPEDMGQPPTQDMGTPPADMGTTPGMDPDPGPGPSPDMGQPPTGNNTTPPSMDMGGEGGDGSASTSSCACRTVADQREGAPAGLAAFLGLLGLSFVRRRRKRDEA